MNPKTKLLLVDDVPANLIALEAVLDNPAYKLVRAHSGDEALKKLLKQEFAVILMNMEMSGMDGFETAQLIRSREKTHEIPIIFITRARKGLAYVSRAYALNAIDYIIKPFDPEILRTRVAVLVDLRYKTDANVLLKLEIAERIRAEIALVQTGRKLARLNDKLELSNRDLQEFAYIASHDLQEPLRKVQAFGDRLVQKYADVLDETGQDYLNRMQAASRRMQILINDLLSLSRISTHAQSFTEVDLNAIAHAVLSDLENQIERTNAQVEIGELLTIQADATQITQLLKNLISNALKFHHDKRPPRIKVSAVIQGESCQISIEDNGIGFDVQYLDRIFKPFQRLHSHTEYEGSGMGLALCRQIVESHGGNITAISTTGEGATFLVLLPLHQTEEINDKDY